MQNRENQEEHVGIRVLVINEVKLSDSGTYQCQVWHPLVSVKVLTQLMAMFKVSAHCFTTSYKIKPEVKELYEHHSHFNKR